MKIFSKFDDEQFFIWLKMIRITFNKISFYHLKFKSKSSLKAKGEHLMIPFLANKLFLESAIINAKLEECDEHSI